MLCPVRAAAALLVDFKLPSIPSGTEGAEWTLKAIDGALNERFSSTDAVTISTVSRNTSRTRFEASKSSRNSLSELTNTYRSQQIPECTTQSRAEVRTKAMDSVNAAIRIVESAMASTPAR